MKQLFVGAKMVLRDEVVEEGSVLIEDGVIQEIGLGSSRGARIIDLGGKTLMPGMIDLHCDALEKEVEPRPNVHFPLDFACAQADKRNAAAGVTTVFHALSFAHDELGVRNNRFAADIARAVGRWQPHALVDNRVHCRYEITDDTGLPILRKLLEENAMHMVSMMDHTPGQGQFKDIAAYRAYLARAYERSAEELDEIIARKMASAHGAVDRMRILADAAHAAGISVASHDDDTAERVAIMRGVGADISEFPVSAEAAKAARAAGMSTVFGAPNILRGESQSGSMKAIDAIHAGVADCLCGDYAPATLVVSVLKVPEQSELDLPAAVRLVTANPALAAKLVDRGEIAEGKRADLIAVDRLGSMPHVSRVWVAGTEVYRSADGHGAIRGQRTHTSSLPRPGLFGAKRYAKQGLSRIR